MVGVVGERANTVRQVSGSISSPGKRSSLQTDLSEMVHHPHWGRLHDNAYQDVIRRALTWIRSRTARIAGPRTPRLNHALGGPVDRGKDRLRWTKRSSLDHRKGCSGSFAGAS